MRILLEAIKISSKTQISITLQVLKMGYLIQATTPYSETATIFKVRMLIVLEDLEIQWLTVIGIIILEMQTVISFQSEMILEETVIFLSGLISMYFLGIKIRLSNQMVILSLAQITLLEIDFLLIIICNLKKLYKWNLKIY